MKKYILICILLVVALLGLIFYRLYDKKQDVKPIPLACNINQPEIDSYSNQVITESINYKVEEKELERQATDGSRRKIYTDKNNDVVLVEDTHSGESGTRVVSVVLKGKKVVKIFDILTQYDVPPIDNPSAKPTTTKDVFYINEDRICSWYEQDKLMDLTASNEQEYLNVVKSISKDAEQLAATTK